MSEQWVELHELRGADPRQELLYNLLPDFLRYSDYYRQQPLRALMAVLELQYQDLESNIAQLYDNWFIETCEDWVIPYLADLLGLRGSDRLIPFAPSQRSLVANTLAYRRRKGTAATLARVAQDATGWYTHVVEYRRLMSRTQALESLELQQGRTVNLRDPGLSKLSTPFDQVAHTPNVFRPLKTPGLTAFSTLPGWGAAGYNLPTLGLFFWRLVAYPVSLSTAWRIALPPPHAQDATQDLPKPAAYTFHPLGVDTPLFNLPRTPSGVTQPNREENLPSCPDPDQLAAELAALRAGQPALTGYFTRPPIFQIRARPALDAISEQLTERSSLEPIPIPNSALWIYDLSDWQRPRPVREAWTQTVDREAIPVLVDPKLGRMLFPCGEPGPEVNVSFRYGSSGDLGGGPYARTGSFATPGANTWVGVVFRDATTQDHLHVHQDFTSLDAALAAWGRHRQLQLDALNELTSERAHETELLTHPDCLIRIADSSTYWLTESSATTANADSAPPRSVRIELQHGQRIIIEAAEERHPTLVGDVHIIGSPNAGLVLNGLWIAGSLTIEGDCDLHLVHCTLRPNPNQAAISVRESGSAPVALTVNLEHSLILGPIRLSTHINGLRLLASIVDGRGAEEAVAIGGATPETFGPASTLINCTLFGKVQVDQLPFAEGCIFVDLVEVSKTSFGEVRHSYLPLGSTTPRRFRCQPDLAAESAKSKAARANLRARMVPSFTADRFGDPAFAQLSQRCPAEIATGAIDSSEMGAFHFLYQPQRAASLPQILDEYLRFGLDVRLSFVT